MPDDDPLDRLFDVAAEASQDDDRLAITAEVLTIYVEHRPDDYQAWFLLGDALRVLGRWQEGENALIRSLDGAAKNDRPAVLARLGMLAKDRGAHADGEEWFKLACDDPVGAQRGWLWIYRGMNLARAGRFEEAERCHRRASLLSEGDPDEAFLNLGYVLRAQRKYAEAIAAFREALRLSPDYPEAKAALAGLDGIFNAISLAASIGP